MMYLDINNHNFPPSFSPVTSVMCFRPTCTIHPSSKLHADNIGQIEISAHRSAVTSVVARHGLASFSTQVPNVPNEPNVPTSDDAPATPDSATALHKCPLGSHQSTLSTQSLSTVVSSDPSLDNYTDSPDDNVNHKKTKKSHDSSSDNVDIHSNVKIMDIDDIEDPQESLNKSNPMADLKNFFSNMPRLLDQTKQCVRCNLCA